jgi:hypothetical protein
LDSDVTRPVRSIAASSYLTSGGWRLRRLRRYTSHTGGGEAKERRRDPLTPTRNGKNKGDSASIMPYGVGRSGVRLDLLAREMTQK